jgi:molybdenum cofactor cytidylyltransferase
LLGHGSSKGKISLILLAAGRSERFSKGNKLLYRVNGEPLIRRIVKTALDSDADEVVLVTGYQSDELKYTVKELIGRKLRVVYNKNYEQGMSASVKAGVKKVLNRSDAVMIHPADVSFISKGTINKLIEEYKKKKPKIAVVSYGGRAGHPIIFDKALFNEILEITEEEMGLKSVINKHRNEILYVNVDEREVLIDIDMVEDVERYLASNKKVKRECLE